MERAYLGCALALALLSSGCANLEPADGPSEGGTPLPAPAAPGATPPGSPGPGGAATPGGGGPSTKPPGQSPEQPAGGGVPADPAAGGEVPDDPSAEPVSPVCGDGQVDAGEGCDDGNIVDGDGCSAACTVEAVVPPRCGDARIDLGESCDDGNNVDGDGCSATCDEEAPNGAGQPAGPMPIPPERLAILDDIPGYGRNTIGGRDGTLYVVTTLENGGPGSLRDAVERDEPLWIVFADGLNGTIRLDELLEVQSYKTIDARGHDITLMGVREDAADPDDGWWNTGVTLGREGDQQTEIRDVVFLNLTFDGNWPDPDRDGEGADGLHIHNNVRNVWVHRCTFNNWIDGAIDARVDEGFDILPRDISVTESHFYDIHQGLLLEARRVTFARNYCDNVNARCVKTIEGGSAHVVNNVIRNWRQREIVFAKGNSQILVDHNVFEPAGDSQTAGRTEGPGDLQDLHNVNANGSRYRMDDRGSVDSAFKSEAQDVYGHGRRVDCEHDPVDRGCWDRLYDAVVGSAGADPDFRAP